MLPVKTIFHVTAIKLDDKREGEIGHRFYVTEGGLFACLPYGYAEFESEETAIDFITDFLFALRGVIGIASL